VTAPSRDAPGLAAAGTAGDRAGAAARAGAWLAGRGDRAVLLACLVGIAAGVGLFLVLPLAPRFVPMHALPTNRDFDVELKPQGLVTPFWVLSMASFAMAVWQWRRGRRLGLGLLAGGALALHLLALLVPPVASKDVYAYSFYGKVQTAYGANPYLSFPDQHPFDLWHPFWSWRLTGPVYGPPFLLLLRGVAMLSGESLLTWVILMKLLLTAAELGAVALLVWVLRGQGAPRADQGWPVLLIAWNPMVLQSIPMSAHVDALLLLVLATAVAAHFRGRRLLAFVLLVVLFLFKVYMGPLAALYALWLAAGQRRAAWAWTVARLGALGAALTALAYLPYASAGAKLFTSAVDVSDHYSSGSPGNIVRRLLAAALPLFGVAPSSAATAGDRAGRLLATLAIVVAFVLVARRLRAGVDPWPSMAIFFLAYFLLTPWVFYWHLLPLLGMVAVIPWGVTSLVAVALSITLVPMAPAGPPALGPVQLNAARDLRDTLVAFASRYGGAMVVLLLALRHRAKARAQADATGEAKPSRGGLGGWSGASEAMRSGTPR
jgi:alpha-1,6-mannosyltransferase